MIKPTIGRVVLVHRGTGQPCPALICQVWGDSCINVGGFDNGGAPFSLCSLHLKQDESEQPPLPYAEWMPYQKGQAAKTEEVERKLQEVQNG